VLVLRHYEGLDDGAIADALGCRRSSVRSLATRGLAALRESPHVREAVDPDPADTRRKP
jgi:DNA-directed RNA polymerase specialized sigma24 family protein